MTIKEIEIYHDMGLMPDWIYYQLNNKSIMENYIKQQQNFYKTIERKQYDSDLEKAVEEFVEESLEKLLSNLTNNYQQNYILKL